MLRLWYYTGLSSASLPRSPCGRGHLSGVIVTPLGFYQWWCRKDLVKSRSDVECCCDAAVWVTLSCSLCSLVLWLHQQQCRVTAPSFVRDIVTTSSGRGSEYLTWIYISVTSETGSPTPVFFRTTALYTKEAGLVWGKLTIMGLVTCVWVQSYMVKGCINEVPSLKSV